MTIEAYGESAIDNQLVAQKDEIIDDINEGRFDTATIKLNFVATLWFSVGYDYKSQELRSRIAAARKAEWETVEN